jgi:hypothetical protein
LDLRPEIILADEVAGLRLARLALSRRTITATQKVKFHSILQRAFKIARVFEEARRGSICL